MGPFKWGTWGTYSGVGACLGHYGSSLYGFIAIVVANEGLEQLPGRGQQPCSISEL